jgi:hypothetical protein
MGIQTVVWVAFVAAIAVVAMLYLRSALGMRKVKLTRSESPGQKPEWMRTTPPPETVAATQADGEGVTLYDYDEGEQVAAPFAEQIEDIIRARLSADPALAALNMDLGTAADGRLEIWLDGERYTDISLLPNERLRQAIEHAIEEWNAGRWEQE